MSLIYCALLQCVITSPELTLPDYRRTVL